MASTEKAQDLKWKSETAGKSNGVEDFEKRWFCVAICHDGSVFMDDADSPVRFLEVLPNAIIAWIDYRTANKDFEKDARLVATQLGFSDQIVSSLSGESRLLYEDLDIEMSMKLPSDQS